jgi:hypothetical protein
MTQVAEGAQAIANLGRLKMMGKQAPGTRHRHRNDWKTLLLNRK